MANIHDRPAKVEDQPVLDHWEGNLIQGARNQSPIGTLVDQQSRYLLMATLHFRPLRLRHVPPMPEKDDDL